VSAESARLWSVPAGAPPAPGADLDVATVALDSQRATVLLGFAEGGLRVVAADAAATALAADALDSIGHRGAVTAVVADGVRGIAVTGGADGFVRAWNLATGEPTTPVLAHAIASGEGPVVAVALSADALSIASAGAGRVKIWSTADGALVRELPLAGDEAVLAFAPGGEWLAIGDRDGVRLAQLGGAREVRAHPARAPVTSVAFAPDGTSYAAGDAAGELHVGSVAPGGAGASVRVSSERVRWVAFGGEDVLLAVTGGWAHSFAARGASLDALHARRVALVRSPAPAFAATGEERLRAAGFDGTGQLRVLDIDLAGAPAAEVSALPELLGRDWPTALGAALTAEGEPTVPDR
jgi:hypothetical protein